MATDLQEDLAEAIVKNKRLPRSKRLNKKDLVVSVGYSPAAAEAKATAIIEAKGVQETLAKWGLTEELITTALVDDIRDKPKKRFLELSLGAEILGMKKKQTEPTTQVGTQTNNFIQIVINKPTAENTGDKSNA